MNSSPVNLSSIIEIIDTVAPFSLAEEWDNVGLLLGDPGQEISGVMVGLDPTISIIDEAILAGANLIITHHPIIFCPLKSIRTDQPTGAFLAKAIKHGIAVVGCHTNLDVVANGVNHILSIKLGLCNLKALLPSPKANDDLTGLGLYGSFKNSFKKEDFLALVSQTLELPVLSVAGDLPENIDKVAVCGGSGSDFIEKAYESGAQVYITGEVKHSAARWAEEIGFCVIDAGHYATENLVTDAFASLLASELSKAGNNLQVTATANQRNPFEFIVARELQISG